MSEAAELARYGLRRCSRCGRVLEVKHLREDGRCKDTWDCVLARQLRWRAGREEKSLRKR